VLNEGLSLYIVVDSIDEFANDFGISKAFIGLILIPIVGNVSYQIECYLVHCSKFQYLSCSGCRACYKRLDGYEKQDGANDRSLCWVFNRKSHKFSLLELADGVSAANRGWSYTTSRHRRLDHRKGAHALF
jgi:hypothetical protein